MAGQRIGSRAEGLEVDATEGAASGEPDVVEAFIATGAQHVRHAQGADEAVLLRLFARQRDQVEP